jgi:hypothetical protein
MSKNSVLPKIRSWLVFSIVVLLLLPNAWAAQGWYLMHPPVNEKTLKYDLNVPLRQWKQMSARDSARECEAAKLNLIKDYRNSLNEAQNEVASNQDKARSDDLKNWVRYQGENLTAAMAARCIASDDPRLK